MSLRKILALAATTLAFAGPAAAQGQFAPVNPPQPTETPGKVEVIEFFWYGCPHCYSLEPAVAKFVQSAPKDVVFRRVPAVPSDAWAEAAKMFYTLEAMGQLEAKHQKVFDAIHQERLNLNNKRIREEWLAKNGIDVAKYNEMEKSFSVATKLQKAKQMTYAYKVDSVPRLVVNGKYYTGPEIAGGTQNMFPVVEKLLDTARKEMK